MPLGGGSPAAFTLPIDASPAMAEGLLSFLDLGSRGLLVTLLVAALRAGGRRGGPRRGLGLACGLIITGGPGARGSVGVGDSSRGLAAACRSGGGDGPLLGVEGAVAGIAQGAVGRLGGCPCVAEAPVSRGIAL